MTIDPNSSLAGAPRKITSTPDQKYAPFQLDVLKGLVLALAFFFVLIVLRTAWLSEDSYIGWRTVENFVHGFGLRWNISDRVQTYTDPLFILLVSGLYAITGEIFLTALTICILLSLAAVYLTVTRVSVSSAAAVAGLAAFISSRSFIDFTTSGLENPLSFLLVALFYLVYLRTDLDEFRKSWLLVFLLALVGLNRLDLILLLLPPVLLVLYTQIFFKDSFWRLIGTLVLASSPLWLWLLFSTIYYGFPFPNTYYAKLHTGIPPTSLMFQGILYYVNEIDLDPVTLVCLVTVGALILARRERRFLIAFLGICLYLLYIVKIGGDFMAGRFFSVPFFAAITLLVSLPLSPRTFLTLAAAAIGIGLIAPRPTMFSNGDYFLGMSLKDVVDHRGIADERGFIYQSNGLLPVLNRNRTSPIPPWAGLGLAAKQSGMGFAIFENIGIYGFYAGPTVHILDSMALGDPLLSKLPIPDPASENWRVGHYRRDVPEGYAETLQSGANLIKDPKIAKLYKVIKLITQDPIWSWRRIKTIFLINTGHYNYLMGAPAVSHPEAGPATL